MKGNVFQLGGRAKPLECEWVPIILNKLISLWITTLARPFFIARHFNNHFLTEITIPSWASLHVPESAFSIIDQVQNYCVVLFLNHWLCSLNIKHICNYIMGIIKHSKDVLKDQMWAVTFYCKVISVLRRFVIVFHGILIHSGIKIRRHKHKISINTHQYVESQRTLK